MNSAPESGAVVAAPRYAEVAPSPALAPWIDGYWSIRALDAPGVPNRVLPDGCADLIVGVPDEPRPMVVGAMRKAAVVPLAGRVDLFGIRFRPGRALQFLDVPLNDLTDCRVPLEEIWGRDAGAIAEACEPGALHLRVAHAERVLRRRLRMRSREWHGDEGLVTQAVSLLRRARGGAGVRQVAAVLGVGERRLERAFGRSVGLSPKLLDRVLRLRRALMHLDRGGTGHTPAAWAAVAFDAGYADQSHLIRDFKALAGLTPARFAAERRGVGFVQYVDGETA